VGVARWQYGRATLAQANARGVGALAESAEDNLISVGKKGTSLAGWKGKRLGSIMREFQ
jgi:hypothetical protein